MNTNTNIIELDLKFYRNGEITDQRYVARMSYPESDLTLLNENKDDFIEQAISELAKGLCAEYKESIKKQKNGI